MNKYLQPRKYLQFSKGVIAAVLRRTPVIRKHHRLRSRADCVTEVCNLIDQNYEGIRSHGLSKTIERRLSWLGINFSKLPAKQKGDLYAIFVDEALHPDRYDDLKQQMLQAPVKLLPCRQWLNLHEMCCFRGKYTLAQIFREKARQLAIKPLDGHAYKPPISWANTIAAAIEGGECESTEELVKLLERAKISDESGMKWHIYQALLLEQNHEIPQTIFKGINDNKFSEFLKNKSISIVGPAPTKIFDAKKIDKYDVVVRVNHTFFAKGTDTTYKGLRTDVSYYNSEQTSFMLNESDGYLPDDVYWGCFKPSRSGNQAIKKNYKRSRSLYSFNDLRFHGNFNMIPSIIMDLLLLSNTTIKVFHVDLMLSVTRQKGYYPNSFNYRAEDSFRMQEIFRKGSIYHDPVRQYRVLKMLLEMKKIKGDDRFTQVMKMGLDAYLLELESIYGVS